MTTPAGERNDAELARAALAGEDAAFTALMQRHKAALYRFIRRYVGEPDEAHDLLQESFLAAWSSLKSFDRGKPMPVWLRRIALNKCRDWSRKRKVRSFFFRASSLDTAGVAPPAREIDADDEARLATLDAAIAALPAQLKEPLILTVFEAMSHKDAAALLGISTKAVETRTYRARQQLRAALGSAD